MAKMSRKCFTLKLGKEIMNFPSSVRRRILPPCDLECPFCIVKRLCPSGNGEVPAKTIVDATLLLE